MRNVNPAAYEHEYLGAANGECGQVFENIRVRTILDEEMAGFERILHGLDRGYYPDLAHYCRAHYDAVRRVLFIWWDVRCWKLGNDALFRALLAYGLTRPTC